MWVRMQRCVGGYSHASADAIAKKTVNQKLDFDYGVTFLSGGILFFILIHSLHLPITTVFC
jgi:hypothetical protein